MFETFTPILTKKEKKIENQKFKNVEKQRNKVFEDMVGWQIFPNLGFTDV